MDRDIASFPDRGTVIGRATVVVAIALVIALIHALRVGSYLNGGLFTLYYSYFSDVLIPFGMYFLICLNDISFRFTRDWRVKALLVFGASSLTELLQAFGVPLLGETFDPLDFGMFAAGTLTAVVVDRVLLERVLPLWSIDASAPSVGDRSGKR